MGVLNYFIKFIEPLPAAVALRCAGCGRGRVTAKRGPTDWASIYKRQARVRLVPDVPGPSPMGVQRVEQTSLGYVCRNKDMYVCEHLAFASVVSAPRPSVGLPQAPLRTMPKSGWHKRASENKQTSERKGRTTFEKVQAMSRQTKFQISCRPSVALLLQETCPTRAYRPNSSSKPRKFAIVSLGVNKRMRRGARGKPLSSDTILCIPWRSLRTRWRRPSDCAIVPMGAARVGLDGLLMPL